ncbi:ABC transporter ATP-binding protein [Magnetospirillum sp. UT-4]|uniref:ABC transporter ATP-binding protein n=1 Tax=Magnetospirillum sp. UT-4 TaxID=2681467 RepID=UPI00137CAC8C|nr:ABC transporter ATP-binding protein [Magnetospirillum sp. UT-4]CAA7612114.1 O-antigen export system ATP-binding protein RfbE [Magnetospirillum sp. UT-4]
MAHISLEDVALDFPIYGSQRSFRHELVKRATGGFIRRSKESGGHVVVRALDSINLEIGHGDRIGLIGHNGAGKTTLLKVLARIYHPTEGSAVINGRVSTLFNILPGLDMDDTGYETIRTCGMFLGMSSTEIDRKTPEIVAFSELGDFLGLPVRTYSSGMMVRLGFAIATSIDPEILILDEGLGAGDARFAERAKQRVDDLVERTSILILASHSDALIQSMCNRAALLHGGRIIALGDVDEVIERYHHLNSEAAAAQ